MSENNNVRTRAIENIQYYDRYKGRERESESEGDREGMRAINEK